MKPARPAEIEFEDGDAPRKKKSRRDDDYDDDDDRPRGRRRRDDDYDDDDDRPRRKRRRRDYDDDDDDDYDAYRRSGSKGSGFGAAKVGVLLLNISMWLYMASLALICLIILIGWVSTGSTSGRRGGGDDTEWIITLVKLPGILGLGNWITAIVGFGFCIAGPQKARGMAITALTLGSVQLILMFSLYFNFTSATGLGSLGSDFILWPLFATTLPTLDMLLPVLINESRLIGGNFVIALFAAVCELLRLIFAMLMVKALARVAKDYDAAEKSQMSVLTACGICGASAGIVLVVSLIMRATKSLGGVNLMIGFTLLIYLGFAAITILPLLATNGARASLARRARRG